MYFLIGVKRASARILSPSLITTMAVAAASAQSSTNASLRTWNESAPLALNLNGVSAVVDSVAVSPVVAHYFDPLQGTSASELVRRALASNGEIAAARLDIERAKARVRQAGMRPNPTIDFEQTTGRLTNSPGESETSVGVSLLLELSGQRRRRIELAQAKLEATEAEVADRERRLAGEVPALYSEALVSLRELEVTEGLTDIDIKTVVVVQARVNASDAAYPADALWMVREKEPSSSA